MESSIVSLTAKRYLTLRHHGPFHHIGGTFEAFFGKAMPLGVPVLGVIGFYMSGPDLPEDQLESYAGCEVPLDFESPSEEFTVLDVPAGDFLKATHMGAYEGLGAAWGEFMGPLLAGCGRELNPAWTYEVYVNDCTEVPVEEVQTDLYASLR